MKMRVTFKTPDAIAGACHAFGVREAAARGDGEDLEHYWADYARDKVRRWVAFGEYLTVDFDLLRGTATVVPA